jgi:hypothetical protein
LKLDGGHRDVGVFDKQPIPRGRANFPFVGSERRYRSSGNVQVWWHPETGRKCPRSLGARDDDPPRELARFNRATRFPPPCGISLQGWSPHRPFASGFADRSQFDCPALAIAANSVVTEAPKCGYKLAGLLSKRIGNRYQTRSLPPTGRRVLAGSGQRKCLPRRRRPARKWIRWDEGHRANLRLW